VMNRYVILLRGVMPTGKNKVPMARLREVVAAAGYQQVRTWIQSGNLLVDSPRGPLETAQDIQGLIARHIGPTLELVALRPQEVAEALAGNPFGEAFDQARVFYSFFTQPPGEGARDSIRAASFPGCQAIPGSLAVYMYVPMDYTRAPLNAGALEKLTGTPMTMRNTNTLRRLLALSQAPEAG